MVISNELHDVIYEEQAPTEHEVSVLVGLAASSERERMIILSSVLDFWNLALPCSHAVNLPSWT